MSTLVKGADTLVYLLLVPVTLGYLNAYEYGIWLTLNSLLSWIDSFDIGLGSGLRNKLGIAIAESDKEKGRALVSTTFFMLIIIVSIIFAIALLAINQIDWYSLLNIDEGSVKNISNVIIASLFFFSVNFVFKFIGNVYQAFQLPAINYVITFSGHLLSLILIFILIRTVPSSLFWVAVVYSASPAVIYMISYPITFLKVYPYLAPSIRYFKSFCLRELLSLSMLFFIIQIMGIVLFSLSNIIISNLFGPDYVTPYNIAYRYYSIVPLLFNLFLAPIWSATTDAYARKDYSWIVKCTRTIDKTLILIGFTLIFMTIISPLVYRIWIGEDVHIPLKLSLLMALYMLIFQFSLSYSTLLNGMGKLRLQAINIVFVGILFYPLCHLLGFNYGLCGIVIAMCILNIPGAILNYIQVKKLISGKPIGDFWAK